MKIKNAIKSIGTILLLAFAVDGQLAWAAEMFPVTPKAFASNRFKLEVEGTPVFVHKYKDIHYAHFPYPDTGSARITVEARRPFKTAELSPKSANIPLQFNLKSETLEFLMEKAGKLVLTLDDKERLFLFSEEPTIDTVSKSDTRSEINSLAFGSDPSGQTLSTNAIQEAIDSAPTGSTVRIPPGHYLAGSLFLKSGLTLLLETGVLLQASPNPLDFEPEQNAFLVVENAEDVTIKGGGTLDGSGAFLRHLTGQSGRLLAIRDSRNVTVEGLILRDPRAWNTHIIRSENVTLRNVKLLNDRTVSNTDGIDPDSSRHILIEDSFFYCGDDAIAIKSSDLNGRFEDVYDITVRDNIILTHKSALKIGTETRASEMSDITFANNEVIECDRGMAIYARDGTHVHSVRFIGNHFERNYPDYQQKLVCFEVKKRNGLSRISNILIQNCSASQRWPEPSTISGFARDYGVSNVRFVNYRYGGKLCSSPAEADLKIGPHTQSIRFEISE